MSVWLPYVWVWLVWVKDREPARPATVRSSDDAPTATKMTASLEHTGVDVEPPPTRPDDTLAAADEPTDSRGAGALVSPPGYDTPLPPDLALRVASAPVARHLASRLRAAGLCVTVSVAAASEQDDGAMAHLLLVAGTPRRLEHAVRGWLPDPHSRFVLTRRPG